MPEQTQLQSSARETAVVSIYPLATRTMMRLKAWAPEYLGGEKAVRLAGRELPSKVGTLLPGPTRVLCIGPGEWLLVSEEHSAASVHEHTAAELLDSGLVLVDLTHGLSTIEVRGGAARELLAKGCGLDLHPRAFGTGQCARTRFAQIPAVIECCEAAPTSEELQARFELSTQRSYFSYLHGWLIDAAAEFAASWK